MNRKKAILTSNRRPASTLSSRRPIIRPGMVDKCAKPIGLYHWIRHLIHNSGQAGKRHHPKTMFILCKIEIFISTMSLVFISFIITQHYRALASNDITTLFRLCYSSYPAWYCCHSCCCHLQCIYRFYLYPHCCTSALLILLLQLQLPPLLTKPFTPRLGLSLSNPRVCLLPKPGLSRRDGLAKWW